MECQIQSMADAGLNNEDEVAAEGRVEQVCREWLIREDGVLAYKLQSEEISQHYDMNRFRNRLVRSDIQEAKVVQKAEDETSDLIHSTLEKILDEQEREDEEMALKLQEKLQEELEKKRNAELEDERLARQLQEKERQRFERKAREKEFERELRQVERARAHQLAASAISADELSLAENMDRIGLKGSEEDDDLSDFCLQPPPGLSGDELRKFQEQQDAELANLLQHQESKRRGPNYRDRQFAIEAQDRELARVLQEQERAKAKKAKERVRQKALQQQQQHDMEQIDEHYAFANDNEDDKESRLSFETRGAKEMERYSPNEKTSLRMHDHEVKNIAIAIDPTYNRRKMMLETQTSPMMSNSSSPEQSPEKTTVHIGDPCLLSSVDSNFLDFKEPEERAESAVPPYMPIQGQRRTSSLGKGKKSKKQKDGCKTQ